MRIVKKFLKSTVCKGIKAGNNKIMSIEREEIVWTD
jgi:hypothetical protein